MNIVKNAHPTPSDPQIPYDLLHRPMTSLILRNTHGTAKDPKRHNHHEHNEQSSIHHNIRLQSYES